MHALDVGHLGLRRGFGEEVVHTGFFSDLLGRQRVVTGDHHRLDTHGAQTLEALTHARLDRVLQVHHAERARAVRDDQRGAALVGNAPHFGHQLLRHGATERGHVLRDGVGGSLAQHPRTQIEPAHPGLRSEWHRCAALGTHVLAQGLLGQGDDALTFGGLVRQGREHGNFGQELGVYARCRDHFERLARAVGDGARFVQHQDIDVAGSLDRASRGCDHVVLHQPVHAGDANCGKQRANGGWDQAHEQRYQEQDADVTREEARARNQAGRRREKDDRQTREQDGERDFVGRLLTLGAFHECDHPVDEATAWILTHLDGEPIREHACAAGDGTAVAAAFSNHGGALAGDGALVHGCDAFDDLAVSRNQLSRLHINAVALLEVGRRNHLAPSATFSGQRHGSGATGEARSKGVGRRAHFAQRSGLCFASALGYGFREIREQHGEPEPDDQLKGELGIDGMTPQQVRDVQDADQRSPDLHHEHDGVLHHVARVQLLERRTDRRLDDRRVEQRTRIFFGLGHVETQ